MKTKQNILIFVAACENGDQRPCQKTGRNRKALRVGPLNAIL